jgi:uncharacterized Zn finger protein
MQITVDDITAQCQSCGGTQFSRHAKASGELGVVLECESCGRKAAHAELLLQISDEARWRANEAFGATPPPRESLEL